LTGARSYCATSTHAAAAVPARAPRDTAGRADGIAPETLPR
jgi:hypothetical protein